MGETLDGILHPRIAEHGMNRYRDGYFKDAAREAMTMVEMAMKEKSGVSKKYGVSLVSSLFGSGQGIKLRVPFGEHMQEPAKKYFESAFGYYRNYAVHEGDRIDNATCLRILVMASDLLFLIGASSVSFSEIGGVEGLVKHGVFKSRDNVLDLLRVLDDYCLPNEIVDGFYEDLAGRGYEDKHLQALFDCGLVEYRVNDVEDPSDEKTDRIGVFYLTPLGSGVLKSPTREET
jgi:Protein of unknown function (Hypoth_ymh)